MVVEILIGAGVVAIGSRIYAQINKKSWAARLWRVADAKVDQAVEDLEDQEIIALMESANDKMEDTIDDLEVALGNMRGKKTVLEGKITAAAADVSEAQGTVDAALMSGNMADAEKAQALLVKRQERHEQLETRLANLVKLIGERSARKNELRAELEQREDKVDDYESDLETTEAIVEAEVGGIGEDNFADYEERVQTRIANAQGYLDEVQSTEGDVIAKYKDAAQKTVVNAALQKRMEELGLNKDEQATSSAS